MKLDRYKLQLLIDSISLAFDLLRLQNERAFDERVSGITEKAWERVERRLASVLDIEWKGAVESHAELQCPRCNAIIDVDISQTPRP